MEENLFDFTFDMTPEQSLEKQIKGTKLLRQELDKNLQNLDLLPSSEETSLAAIKVREAIMWLGMNLKRLNQPNPYPESYNPENTKIEPTADNLKL